MVAYRFCRPDDVPRLVAAVNRCWTVHFPGAAPFTVEDFRREMKEVQLWPSNSMIASAGEEPVAVLLGTKRPREVLVRRIGVAPGHQRRGHGSHLLSSLSQKLAVLGPPRLLAEVPAELVEARAFFAATGWAAEGELGDWERPAIAPQPVPADAFAEVGVTELAASGLLPPAVAWERQPESLQALEGLRGLALCGADRLEAWALYRPRRAQPAEGAEANAAAVASPGPGAEVYGLGCANPERSTAALGLVCARLAGLVPGPLRLRAVAPGEHAEALLAGLGFRPVGRAIRFVREVATA